MFSLHCRQQLPKRLFSPSLQNLRGITRLTKPAFNPRSFAAPCLRTRLLDSPFSSSTGLNAIRLKSTASSSAASPTKNTGETVDSSSDLDTKEGIYSDFLDKAKRYWPTVPFVPPGWSNDWHAWNKTLHYFAPSEFYLNIPIIEMIVNVLHGLEGEPLPVLYSDEQEVLIFALTRKTETGKPYEVLFAWDEKFGVLCHLVGINLLDLAMKLKTGGLQELSDSFMLTHVHPLGYDMMQKILAKDKTVADEVQRFLPYPLDPEHVHPQTPKKTKTTTSTPPPPLTASEEVDQEEEVDKFRELMDKSFERLQEMMLKNLGNNSALGNDEDDDDEEEDEHEDEEEEEEEEEDDEHEDKDADDDVTDDANELQEALKELAFKTRTLEDLQQEAGSLTNKLKKVKDGLKSEAPEQQDQRADGAQHYAEELSEKERK